MTGVARATKICPECGYSFRGNGFDGIDAHWRAKHEHLMSYSLAWPLIRSGRYRRRTGTIADFSGCRAREDTPVFSIEEINEIIAKGWAGEFSK